jgi:hypothetical protein
VRTTITRKAPLTSKLTTQGRSLGEPDIFPHAEGKVSDYPILFQPTTPYLMRTRGRFATPALAFASRSGPIRGYPLSLGVAGKLVLYILGSVAQFERQLMIERTV